MQEGLLGPEGSIVQVGFKNRCSEDLLNLSFFPNPHHFPLSVFVRLHLHCGNSLYLRLQSRLSAISLLLLTLFQTFQWSPLPSRQNSSSLASQAVVSILWLLPVNSSPPTLDSQEMGYFQFTLCCYLLSVCPCLYFPVWEAFSCWQMSTCLSRCRTIFYLLCLHLWVKCLD